MTDMLVYRIEHRETGIGPYHSSQKQPGLRQWNKEYETMPPPRADFDGLHIMKRWHRFAHPDLIVIQTHYRKRIIKWLDKKGYLLVVYKLYKDYIVSKSGKQVVFNIKHAEIIEIKPLKEVIQ